MSQKVLVSESKAAAIEKVKSASRVVPVNPKKNATNSRVGLSIKHVDNSSQSSSTEQISSKTVKKNTVSTTRIKSNDVKDSHSSHLHTKERNSPKLSSVRSTNVIKSINVTQIDSVRKSRNVRPSSAVSNSLKSSSTSSVKSTKPTSVVVPSPKVKSVSPVNKDHKTRRSSAPTRKNTSSTTNFVLKNATRPLTSKSSNRPSSSPKNAVNISSPKQRLGIQTKPLQNSKKSNKGLPPTAVVSPIQDKSKTLSPNSKEDPIEDPLLEKNLKKSSMISDLSPTKHASQTISFNKLPTSEKSSESSPTSEPQETLPVEVSKEDEEKMREIGHYFKPHELKQWVNWCDACGGVIVSMFGAALSCKKCNMLCHMKCALAVSLTCAADEDKEDKIEDGELNKTNKPVMEETTDEATLKEYNTIKRVIPADEVQEKIDIFNQTVKGIYQMTLQEDGETFRGFIRVSMNLIRPVSVSDQVPTPHRGNSKEHSKASFYVDKGALKALNITSDTTAEQVVRTLLHKYNITDNPMKFALFERQVKEEEHVILRKMLPRERPLLLRLLWGESNSEKEFLLQENETRDIEWEAFSVAELQMFIKILDKEENDYEMMIKRRYRDKAEDIKRAIDYQNKKA